MSKVFVVDSQRKPLDPIHPGWARRLLSTGQAAVLRRYPFTLILKKTIEEPEVQQLRIKLDPGSRTTGIAIVNDQSGEIVFAASLSHRGYQIKKALDGRRSVRRSRRARHTRYRKSRFSNRRRKKGWLPPSLMSRIANILTWVPRLVKWCPIGAISMELVRFDMQAIENPEISGTEYQQGTLFGYEVREYLLLKWGHACAYCRKQDVPLQVEHIVPKAKGGTNRVSNLCIACQPCNDKKGTQDLAQFLKKKSDLLKKIQAQAKTPLKDATAVNATRWALYERFQAFGLPLECGSGGLTKFNRTSRGLPKTHWCDAACVGKSTPETLTTSCMMPLHIEAKGHGNRKMCYPDKFGFPKRHRKRQKKHFGYQTGDLVRAVVPKGKYQGVHVGRVLARATGSFDIDTSNGKAQGIAHSHCSPIHQDDGYSYTTKGARHSSPASMTGEECRKSV
jgi:5-methylcytosine-specific restriction endonuclease McrA